jgi:hypothetical protein
VRCLGAFNDRANTVSASTAMTTNVTCDGSFSGGSPHLSAISWQTRAISVRTSNTTRSMTAPDRKIATRRAPRRQA